MILALRAKDKLCFINGKIEQLEENSVEYDQWHRVDSMIMSWILNAMSKELLDAFLYVTNFRELWIEIEERFVESNGPMLYQIKREINVFSQGNMPVSLYFTKLKKLWDELACLLSMLECNCGAAKLVAEREDNDHVIQFLIGLGDHYDNVKNQILLIEPLPSISKVFSMVQRVEKQREVHDNLTNQTVILVKTSISKREYGGGKQQKRGEGRKKDRQCTYCHKIRHIRETSFKLNGFPDWFQELKQKKGKQ